MKKLIFALAFVLLAGLCFAQEEGFVPEPALESESENLNIEVLVGISVHSTKGPTAHDFLEGASTDKVMTSNTMVGFAMTFALQHFVGLTLESDLFFGGEMTGQSNLRSASISLFGANVLFGPVIYLYKYRTFRIPLTVGAHMSYWDSTTWLPTLNTAAVPGAGWLRYNDVHAGIALAVGIHFYFTHNAYMISRATVAVDMYRWHRMRVSDGAAISDASESEFAVGWGIKPTIGLGLKF